MSKLGKQICYRNTLIRVIFKLIRIDFHIFEVMNFWAIIGIISSIFGICSFLKNDTSLFSFLKKKKQILLKPYSFSFLEFVFKKRKFAVASTSLATYKKNLI